MPIRQDLARPVPAPYAPLITRMKFFVEPEISCARFFSEACVDEDGKRTALGETVAEHATDGLFVDIPCGLASARDPLQDPDLLPLIASLGFARCWEVDLTADVVRDRIPGVIDVRDGGYRLMDGIGEIGLREEAGLSVATMQDDLLGFVAKMTPTGAAPVTFYLSAIQPDDASCADTKWQRDIAVPYLTALFDELARICRPQDLVILNSAAMLVAGIDEARFPEIHPLLALGARGFRLLRTCPRTKVQVFANA